MKSHFNETTKLLPPKEVDSKSYTSYLRKHIEKPWVESIIPFFNRYFHSEIGANACHPDNLCPNLILACVALPFCLTCGTAYCMCTTIPAPCNAYDEMKRNKDKDRFFKPSLAPTDQRMDESEKPTFVSSEPAPLVVQNPRFST